ncbi:MAG: hypothetical protein E7638_01755 [Ruminococcaceae bacterium]|nr:hypothetical protein [Oscillospiraceae bacterium]
MKAAIEKEPDIIALPNIAERRQVHLINPHACSGKHTAMAKRLAESTGGEIVMSEHGGFAEEYAAELFTKDRFAHLVVYGGDGTVCEAVNGIMKSGNNHTASFSVIPVGSGNDFSAYANDGGMFKKAELVPLDICRANDRFFINMLNIGFDCSVVYRTLRYKKNPLIRGKMKYIAGVVGELVNKKPISVKITMDRGDELDTSVLLTACANGRFCGGGFCAAPLADMMDGLMDVLVVKDISRREFISMVGDYKNGTYIESDGTMKKKFEDILMYRRCREYRVSGIERYCIDGELIEPDDGTVAVSCIKNGIWFAAL